MRIDDDSSKPEVETDFGKLRIWLIERKLPGLDTNARSYKA